MNQNIRKSSKKVNLRISSAKWRPIFSDSMYQYPCSIENTLSIEVSNNPFVKNACNTTLNLTYWGRVTHICVGNLIIIDSGLPPGRCQAITWTKVGILSIGPMGANFNEILSESICCILMISNNLPMIWWWCLKWTRRSRKISVNTES